MWIFSHNYGSKIFKEVPNNTDSGMRMRVATLNLVTQRKEKCSQTRSMAVKIEKAVKPHQIKRSTKTVTVLITVFALILSLLSISTLSNDNSGLTHGAPHFLDVKLSPSNLQLSTGQTGTFMVNKRNWTLPLHNNPIWRPRRIPELYLHRRQSKHLLVTMWSSWRFRGTRHKLPRRTHL